MVGKAAIGQSRQEERQWGNQVVEMTEEKNKGREIGQKRKEREAEIWGKRGRKKRSGLLGKPWKSHARLSCKADSDAPVLTWSFESQINPALDSFAKEKIGWGREWLARW